MFAEIDRKIAEAKAKGHEIISLGIGDPDTPTIPSVVEAMHKAIDNPKNHDYPPYNGTADFRKASCDWMKKRFGVELNPDTQMLANIGSKEAIAHIFFAFVDEGDYTLVPDPGYPVYKNAEIWRLASRRFIDCASGNVTAFVDNADPRSVFRSEELPAILRNPKILTINGVDKFAFASRFEEFAEKEASATLRTVACSA